MSTITFNAYGPASPLKTSGCKGDLKLSAEQLAFLARVTEYAIKTRYPDMELQFKRQCTQEFCAAELKEIREFGIWIEKMVTS